MINRMYADQSNAAARLFREATIAQLAHAKDEIENYLPHERGYADASQMPHEWGSLDTYDDARNSLRFANALLQAILDAPAGEDEQREELRRIAAEDGNALVMTERFTALVYPDMSAEEVDADIERRLG